MRWRKGMRARLLSLFDHGLLVLLLVASLLLTGRAWLHDHPEDDPWAPLSLRDPPGWATGRKLAAVRADLPTCRAFLERSDIPAEPLPAVGSGICRRSDRERVASLAAADVALRPRNPQATCAVDAGLAYWLRHGVQPAARLFLHSPVVRIEQLGTYNCRRIGGGKTGTWSQHSTGNAIDISAFVTADGQRVTVLGDWKAKASQPERSAFLHAVRDAACMPFSTVLSPDYNAAHANHLHLDQARRTGGWKACH
ncbi:extensin family protein [Novosphingobium sp. 9]|uniref:extensin-like domain-containing protein n=1 Tax=Novosphingobium sp. 9 TaxID=2025349 RepID=UPI0021B4F7BC|nr:extensin family protein [Novosphingobium sp. 9]